MDLAEKRFEEDFKKGFKQGEIMTVQKCIIRMYEKDVPIDDIVEVCTEAVEGISEEFVMEQIRRHIAREIFP